MRVEALTGTEQRVLGCLIEKRFTTPDHYPLSLNALRLACNQATNRDPVTNLDETTVRDAAQRLCRYGLARLASGHTSRATKYRHLVDEALGLDRQALALLAVLLLRGPQTPGELKSRTERMVTFGSLADAEEVLLQRLGARGLARRLERRPGQKEDRFVHRLGQDKAGSVVTATRTPALEETPPPASPTAPSSAPPVAPEMTSPASTSLVQRLAALEAEVAELRARLDAVAPPAPPAGPT